MFVHCVYFWLKPGLSADEEGRFVAAARKLASVASVRHGWLGKPAATDRPVIDWSYSYGMTLVFDDKAGHDAYQVDPIHTAFVQLAPLWTQIKIYDFE